MEFKQLFLSTLPKLESLDFVDHRHYLIYGRTGCGKTTLLKTMVALLVEYYGRENCNIVYVKREEPFDWFYFMDAKPVQILILDDASFVKISKELASLFTDIRHQLEDNGVEKGIVITIVAGHRLHVIDMAFRMFVDMFCIMSAPFNQWDESIISKTYNLRAYINELRKLDREKMENPEAKSRFYVWMHGRVHKVEFSPKPFHLDKIVEVQRKVKEEIPEEKKDRSSNFIDTLLTIAIVYGTLAVLIGAVVFLVIGAIIMILFYL